MNMDKTPIAGDGGGDAGGGGGGSGNGPEMQSSLDAVAPSPTPHTELDISSMPDTPLRKPGHRRALSEIIGLPDDLDLGGPGAGDAPALSDENEEELFSMFLDVDKLNSRCGASESEPSCAMAGGPGEATETSAAASGAAQGQMHHHNRHSMDASSSIDAEHLFGTTVTEGVSPAEAKKAMSAANLAELALIDPKKAKRIINNRQSAARSKERKMRYIAELERKVQFMQREATALATQLALLQRDTAGLTVENGDLKIRLESTEQQIHLQDALNGALKSEMQRLKMATGQAGNQMMNFAEPPHTFGGANQQVFHHPGQAVPPFLVAMQQQQQLLLPHMNQPLHPLQSQQLHQAATLSIDMEGLPAAPPGQWQWGGDTWSESSSS
ncbi:transcription factor RF2a isoform X2 [Zea mays]|uniref:Putative bZIP transcription factor superfamily protein n=2 Tax=Zea mays TaxID=4577 RepID=A0A1D6QJ26_MAIZE|nr:transcription factor RF2a isoform X2 [Zea mays]AQK57803.1 Putative bZIP transcription factor superfamily protein [Zea mays]